MADTTDKYAQLGVDAGKENVRSTFKSVNDNMFPNAFVNIVCDPDAPGIVVTQHGDGDGSKGIQRLLAYLETGDPIWLKGAVDDAVSMNMGDTAASGFLSGLITWTNNLNLGRRAGGNLKQAIMAAYAERFAELRELYQRHGFKVRILGGETADLPDQIETSVFDVTVGAREKEENIITGNVQPGDVIFGFASDGQAAWEDCPNSGIMSNGLTLAGTCLGWSGYNEKYDLRLKNPFTGKYRIGDRNSLLGDLTVFEALLSPTRQWALLINILVAELQKRGCLHMLHGISMNTGGGATKIAHVGAGITYVKIMPTPGGIFPLIMREGQVTWREMFKDFNCGIGLDVVGQDHKDFRGALNAVSHKTAVALFELGYTEQNQGDNNRIVLKTQFGTFEDY